MAGEAILTNELAGGVESRNRETASKIWAVRAVVFFLAWTLGQAMIYHHDAPFVWIFLVIIWRRRRRFYAAGLLGAIIGTWMGIGWVTGLSLFLWSFIIPLPWRWRYGPWLHWPMVGLGAAFLYWVAHPKPLTMLYPDMVAILVAAGALGLYHVANVQIDRLSEGLGDHSVLVLAWAALGAFLAGLAGYNWGLIDPALVLGGLMMAAAAVLDGPAGGAVAGATLGITLAMRGADPAGGVGILVAGGFMAGWAAAKHWRLAAPGLLTGVIVYAVVVRMPYQLTTFWLSLGLAGVLSEMLPDRAAQAARQWVSRVVNGPPGDSFAQRLERIASVMAEMARAFRMEEDLPRPETNLVEAVVNSVCRKCSLYRACWEEDFYRSYRGVLDLIAKAESDVVTEQHLSGDLARRCIRPDRVAQAANLAMTKERERANLALRVRESRALAEIQLTGLAQLVRDMAQAGVPPETARRVGQRRPLDYAVGVAKRPRRGGLISGDSELICELPGGRVIFGLSDGMGVGPRAAWESGTAMSLMEQLLLAGFSQTLAVRAVNTTLLLRSVDDHFATLDLLLVDRVERGAELVKVAAAPTFLRRGGRVEVIQAHTLPVGILQEVPVEPVYHTLEPGDVVVLVTDGVLENGQDRGEERLADFLRELPRLDAKMMAESILSFMLGGDEDGRDDAAVMVVEIMARDARSESPSRAYEHPVGEWRRLTPKPVRRHAKGTWGGR